jgi:hypothetical protein
MSAIASARHIAWYGESITYTSIAGVGTEITAAWYPQGVSRSAGAIDRNVERASCLLAASAIASPEIEATITHGSDVWHIESRQPVAAGAYWRLQLSRATDVERATERHRLR